VCVLWLQAGGVLELRVGSLREWVSPA